MKKIVRILKKRASHGFTLVEMVISVALLGILLGGMMIFISPILRSFNDNKNLVSAENVANCMQEYVMHNLRNATQIVIVTNASYDDLGTNTLIAEAVADMKNDEGEVKNHVLKCMSLRYVDGKYILCNEPFGTGSTLSGNSNASALTGKVFNDCLYNNMYMNFDFEMAKVFDSVADDGTKLYVDSKDTLILNIKSYSDIDRKDMIFSGRNVTELRQIKVKLRAGAKESDYYVKTFDAGGSDETHSDIYIFYSARQLKGLNG